MNIIERAMKRHRANKLRKEAAELFTYNCGIAWSDGFDAYGKVAELEAEASAIERELEDAARGR